MKKIIDYFVNNSMVVNLLTLLIVVMGTISLFSLNKETFPNVDFNYIVISTTYPGAAAEDVEKLLTLDIERELKEVDGLEELNALSAEGGSIVSLKIDPDYDVDEVLVEVKDAMDKLGDLPDDVDDPVITRLTNKTRGIMNVAFYGDDEWSLRQKTKALRDTLERDPRVSKAQMTGYRDEIFYIEADLGALKKYEMTLGELSQAIQDRQVNVSAGNIKGKVQEKLVRTLVENETVSSIENIVVRSTEFGQAIKVSDVAKVSRALKDAQREDRSEGELAIFIDIAIKSSADVLESAEFIKETLKVESEKLGLKYKIYNDFSFYVERRLGVLTQNGVQGIILVVVCLMFFLNAKVSVITALGAPFAFFFAFSLMDGFGITVNLISMFGLIMVLGMLVDDSIIVAEQYYQKLEQGMPPKKAAKEAAWETLGPVTATIITTMVAFGSLFYMEGIMGKFLWPIPAVVIIALAASWLECFLILPGHLADFAGHDKNVEKSRWYLPLLHGYERVLKVALKFNKTTLVGFIALFALSIFTITTMRFELFPSDDVTRAQINIKGPVGTPFEVTRDQLLKIEKAVFESIEPHELVGVQTISGYQSFKGGRSKSGTHYGSISLELVMDSDRDRSTNEILAAATEKSKAVVDPKFEFSIEKTKNGPPTGKAINVELYGDDLDLLEKLANEVKRDLLNFDGVLSAEVDFEQGKTQIIARVNEAEARRLRVSNMQIALELRRAFEGST
ncbi:MAG: efflux RND transporter permease subunit, partial [Bacteriovoracaceae bacterium]|nr:efflux RND transporter permease subunit [Bacteriovoracaceae bacterium]